MLTSNISILIRIDIFEKNLNSIFRIPSSDGRARKMEYDDSNSRCGEHNRLR